VATTSSSYVFKEVTNQLTNGNSTIRDHGVLRYGNKVYFTTNAGGYCYLVEVDKQGNARSLQLFANDYDPAFGEDDYHGTPAIEWIEEDKKILAVGGGHGTYTPMKWAVINVETWSIEASGDFGSTPLTYPVLVRTSDGKISAFMTDESSGTRYIVWYEFDPSNNSWTKIGQVTNAESKSIYYLGKNIDNGYHLLGIPAPGTYNPSVLIQFDPVNKKFYDHQGNELTPPFNHSSLPANIYNTAYIINGYIYGEYCDEDNGILYLKKWDNSFNELASVELANKNDGANASYLTGCERLLYIYDTLFVAYRSNTNKFVIAEVDLDTLSLNSVYESSSSDIPLTIHAGLSGAFAWYNLIDTSGQRSWSDEMTDDHITYIVFVDPAEPSFLITSYPSQVSGSPGESKSFQVEVSNDGGADGVAELRIKDHNGNTVFSEQKTIPAGTCYLWNVTITLPSTPGTYQWTIEVYNVNTSSVDDSKSFTVEVTGEGEGVVPVADWMSLLMQMMLLMLIIMMIMLPVLIITS